MTIVPLVLVFEMFLTLLILSTSAKVALSYSILRPIEQTLGVSGQTSVPTFSLGNGLVNMFAPAQLPACY